MSRGLRVAAVAAAETAAVVPLARPEAAESLVAEPLALRAQVPQALAQGGVRPDRALKLARRQRASKRKRDRGARAAVDAAPAFLQNRAAAAKVARHTMGSRVGRG